MTQLHIVTVGISLLTNYAKASNLPLEKVLQQHKQLAEFLKADPRAACSEINSLAARTGFLRRRTTGLAVSLVYSATAGRESHLTARLIGNFLKQHGVEVAELKLKDIGVPANPQSVSENCAGSCGEGFWLWPRRRGPSIPNAGCKDRANAGHGQ
ncbi:MAG: hypothetical protein FJ398_09475, partial [Verrucomicrobia bacterium]|nr:hypothetical protein [Verrucomicrobiota bacterium]